MGHYTLPVFSQAFARLSGFLHFFPLFGIWSDLRWLPVFNLYFLKNVPGSILMLDVAGIFVVLKNVVSRQFGFFFFFSIWFTVAKCLVHRQPASFIYFFSSLVCYCSVEVDNWQSKCCFCRASLFTGLYICSVVCNKLHLRTLHHSSQHVARSSSCIIISYYAMAWSWVSSWGVVLVCL